jgi:hypothetical protein
MSAVKERAALLECTDPEIRSRVERILGVEPSGQILDQSPDGFPDDPTRTALAVGAHLGPYRIEAQIGAGGKWLISENGGSSPMWRQDGKELYYIDLDGKLMAVSVTAGSDFQAGVPKALFQAPPRVSADIVFGQWAASTHASSTAMYWRDNITHSEAGIRS